MTLYIFKGDIFKKRLDMTFEANKEYMENPSLHGSRQDLIISLEKPFEVVEKNATTRLVLYTVQQT